MSANRAWRVLFVAALVMLALAVAGVVLAWAATVVAP